MPGILLAIAYAALFIWIIRKHSFFQAEGISRNAFTFAFIAKLLFGIAFWAVYTFQPNYQSSADAFLFFSDGKAIYQALFEHPLDYFRILLGSSDPSLQHYIENTGHWERTFNQGLYNETRTVIRFNAIVDIFSFGNYHVHTVFMCFVSFLGLTGLFRSFLPFFAEKKKELYVIIFFLPSVLFWGSGVMKEGLILLAEGMIVYHWFRWLKEGPSPGHFIFILLFIALLSITKLYMLLFLLPALIAYTWLSRTKQKFAVLKMSVVLLILFIAGLMNPRYDLPFMLMEKQRQTYYVARGGSYLGIIEKQKFVYIDPTVEDRITYIEGKPGYCKINPGVPYKAWFRETYLDTEFVKSSEDTATYWCYYSQVPAGSYIRPSLLEPTVSSLLLHSPGAFFITAFRPHIFEAKNPLMIFSAVENLFIAAFILICLIFYSRKVPNKELIFFCLFITVLLFTLVGLTTPILGAVVRYKVPALPFLLIAFLLILDKEKLLQKLPILRKIL